MIALSLATATMLMLPGSSIPRAPLPSDDAAIFAAVASEWDGSEEGADLRDWIIVQETEDTRSFEGLLGSAAFSAPLGCVRNLRRRNARPALLPAFFGRPARFVPGDRINAIFARGFWDGFYRTFPNTHGIWKFSLPGYSLDAQAALIYYSHSSGCRCGGGALLYLEKHGGHWRVKRDLGGWIS